MSEALVPVVAQQNRWAWLGRLAASAVAGVFLAWCVVQLRREGDRMDLGYLFDLGLLAGGLLIYAGGRWMDDRSPRTEALSALAALAAAFAMAAGARISVANLFSVEAFPWYCLGAGLFGAAVMLRPEAVRPEADEAGHYRGAWAWLALLATAALFGYGVVWMDRQIHTVWDLFENRNSTSLFFFRRTYGATDMVGEPFREWSRLSAVAAMGAVLAVGAWALRSRGAERTRAAFYYLLGAAVLGKLALAHLNYQSVMVIGDKVRSVNTNYLNLAAGVDARGLFGFIRDYTSFQFAQGAHGDTHSFAPIVFYWVLSKICLGNNLAIGLCVATICALIVWPIHALATRIYGSPKAGLAAGIIYLLTPMSLILSGAGIDGVAALLVALVVERLDAAARDGRWQPAAQAGAALFACSLMSFGGTVVLIFGGLWLLKQSVESAGGWVQGLGRTALTFLIMILVALALHALLYGATGGKFNYVASMRGAAGAHRHANFYRVYGLWAWANVFLYAGYIGLGTLAAWSLRLGKALWQGDGRDPFLAFGALQVMVLIMASMGRGEVQREFVFGAFFLAVPAVAFVLNGRGRNAEVRWGLVALIGALNVANAAVLQIVALDFW